MTNLSFDKITNQEKLKEKAKKLMIEKNHKKVSSWMYYQSLLLNSEDEHKKIFCEILKIILMYVNPKIETEKIAKSSLEEITCKILEMKEFQNLDKILQPGSLSNSESLKNENTLNNNYCLHFFIQIFIPKTN